MSTAQTVFMPSVDKYCNTVLTCWANLLSSGSEVFFTVRYKIFQASFSLQSSYLWFYFPFKSFPWLILTEQLNVSILKRLLPVLLVTCSTLELLRVGGGLVRLGWVSKNSLILPLAVQLRLIFFSTSMNALTLNSFWPAGSQFSLAGDLTEPPRS